MATIKISDLSNKDFMQQGGVSVSNPDGTPFIPVADKIATPAPQQKKGFLERAGGIASAIFPGQKTGEAIGTATGFGLTALKEKLGLVPEGTTSQFDISAPSPTQVAGDVASGALTVAGFKGAGIGKTALGTIGKGTALGGGLSGSRSISEGNTAGEVLKDTATGAVVGGAVSTAGVAVEKMAEGLKALPSRLVRSATGQSKKEILAGKDLTKFVVDNKKVGTATSLLKDSKSQIEVLSSDIATNLKGSTKTLSQAKIFDNVSKSKEVQNALLNKNEVKDIVVKLAPQAKKLLGKKSLSLSEANQLRQLLDSTIGDRGFLSTQQTLNKQILKQFANSLREQVKTLAPEGTRGLFSNLSSEITLRNNLANKIAQGSRNQIISFGDLIGGSIGGAVGGVPGAFAGAALRRGVQSTPALTGGAVIADKLSNSLLPILQNVAPAVQTEIISAIEAALNESQ